MKAVDQSKGRIAEKKPRSSATSLSLGASEPGASVSGNEARATKSAFGSPSDAVWTRYIDSRMKQFGTR